MMIGIRSKNILTVLITYEYADGQIIDISRWLYINSDYCIFA